MNVELKEVFFFVAGLIGGFLTNQFFFKKQTVLNEQSERNLYMELDRHYEQALRDGIRNAEILEIILNKFNPVLYNTPKKHN